MSIINARDDDYIDVDGKIIVVRRVKKDGAEDVQLRWRSFRPGNTSGFSSDYMEMFLPNIDEGDEFTIGPFKFKATRWHGKKAWMECEKIK